MHTKDLLLIEIGTLDLPAGEVLPLSQGLSKSLQDLLEGEQFGVDRVQTFASPRRLALWAYGVLARQPSRVTIRKGPSRSAAFDSDGKPTPVAVGFARSCNIGIDALRISQDGRLLFEWEEPGKTLESCLSASLTDILSGLPQNKKMRWGSSRHAFIRPIQWIVAMHGAQQLNITVMGVPSGRSTVGRLSYSSSTCQLMLENSRDYLKILEQNKVQPSPEKRRQRIEEVLRKYQVPIDTNSALIDEQVMMTEFPSAVRGSYDEDFLHLPPEVRHEVISNQQKLFASTHHGRPSFVAIIDSPNPDIDAIRSGYERVLHPRLVDALFFYHKDKKQKLSNFAKQLKHISFHEKLGNLAQKVVRIKLNCTRIIRAVGGCRDSKEVLKAASLCKADLASHMVREYPGLQGTMGRLYACSQGIPECIADSLEQHYWPRTAAGQLPETSTAAIVSLADRLDILCAIFGLGEYPSGSKDPYALRRHSIAAVRIIIDQKFDCDLAELINDVCGETHLHQRELLSYLGERIKHYFRDVGYQKSLVSAAMATRPFNVYDLHLRLPFLKHLSESLESCKLLLQTCKRLKMTQKHELWIAGEREDVEAFCEDHEWKLYYHINELESEAENYTRTKCYRETIDLLGKLCLLIEQFFQEILVMSPDKQIRKNRLIMLARAYRLFLCVADFSKMELGNA